MNITEPRLLRVEAVADLPILWATFQRLDLPAHGALREAQLLCGRGEGAQARAGLQAHQ